MTRQRLSVLIADPSHRNRALGLAVWASFAAGSCSIFHEDLPNESPVVQVREADTTRVKRGGRVSLRVTASDEDDDPLFYLWLADAGSFTDSTDNATDWIAPNEILGESEFFVIRVMIQDRQLETEDPVETFLIEVVQRPPVLQAVPESRTVTARDTVVLAALADDEDGDELTYLWMLDGGVTSSAHRTRGIHLTDEQGDTVAVWRAIGQGSHHVDGDGAAWIRQQRSSGEDADTVRVEVIPLATVEQAVRLAVTDAIDSPSDTITSSFVIQVEAAVVSEDVVE